MNAKEKRGAGTAGEPRVGAGEPAPASPYRISIVDDDESARDFLTATLRLYGYSVSAYETPGRFLDRVAEERPHLLLLDLDLPGGINGLSLLRSLREQPAFHSLLIVLVSGKHRDTKDVVLGLQHGADDYFTQPIQPEFLLARVGALLRRAIWRDNPDESEASIRFGPLAIHSDSHVARLEDRDLRLTPLEFELLSYLVQHRNRVLTRGVLLESVWKADPSITTRTVDKHVEALRKKLGALGKKIETVIGIGYVLRG